MVFKLVLQFRSWLSAFFCAFWIESIGVIGGDLKVLLYHIIMVGFMLLCSTSETPSLVEISSSWVVVSNICGIFVPRKGRVLLTGRICYPIQLIEKFTLFYFSKFVVIITITIVINSNH